MHIIKTKFKPLDFVNITLYGLHFTGRIIRVIVERNMILYDCDYNCDGDLRRREFYEDELEELKK